MRIITISLLRLFAFCVCGLFLLSYLPVAFSQSDSFDVVWVREVNAPIPVRFLAIQTPSSIDLTEEFLTSSHQRLMDDYAGILQATGYRAIVASFYSKDEKMVLNTDGSFKDSKCSIVFTRDRIYGTNLGVWSRENTSVHIENLTNDLLAFGLCSQSGLNIPFFELSSDFNIFEISREDTPTKAQETVLVLVRSNIGKDALQNILNEIWVSNKDNTGFSYLPRVSHLRVYAGISGEALSLGSYIGTLTWDRATDGDHAIFDLEGWDGYKTIQKRILELQSGIVTSRLNMVLETFNENLLNHDQLPMEIDPSSRTIRNQVVGVSVAFGAETNTGGDSIQFTVEVPDTDDGKAALDIYHKSITDISTQFFVGDALTSFLSVLGSNCERARGAMTAIGTDTNLGSKQDEFISTDLRAIFQCDILENQSERLITQSVEITSEQDNLGNQRVPIARIKDIGTNIYAGDEVLLDATDSTDADGEIVSYRWSLPGERIIESDDPVQSVTFDREGNWLVVLEILDNHGNTAEATTRVRINCNLNPGFLFEQPVRRLEEVQFSTDPSMCKENVISVSWDFDGDGAIDEEGATVVHIFDAIGDHLVTQIIAFDNGESLTFVGRISVELNAEEARRTQNASPSALIEIANSQPMVGQSIFIDGANSFDADGSIISYEWSLSDGTVSEGVLSSLEHAFLEEGTKTVTLTVIDNNGARSQTQLEIFVDCILNSPFEVTGTVMVNREIEFKSNKSLCRNSISAVNWDFDTDGLIDSTGRIVKHTFEEPGEYLVSQIIVLGDGEELVQIERMQVRPEQFEPMADFRVVNDSIKSGIQISFDASGSRDEDGNIVEFQWDFDGDRVWDMESSDPLARWSYRQPGDYVVTVEVTDDQGLTSRKTLPIEVLPNPNVSTSNISGFIGMFDSTPLYKVSLSIPLNEWIMAGASWGMGQNRVTIRDFPVDLGLQSGGVHVLLGVTNNLRIGIGAGATLLQQTYEIDSPVEGSNVSNRVYPHVSLIAGFQWGYLMFGFEVNYVPKLF